MRKNEIFSKEWCEMLFEHRNKRYGAYRLREDTGKRYRIALTVLFSFFLLVSLPPAIIWMMEHQPQTKIDPIKKIVRFEGIRIKEARPLRRPPKKSAPEVVKKEDMKNAKDIPDDEKMAAILHPEDQIVDPEKIKDLPLDSMETLRREAELNLAKSTEQTDGVIIDSIPRFPTGIMSLMRWLNKTVVYPPDCARRHISGTVEVAFIVEKNGKVTDPRIIKGAHPELNREALRVVGLMTTRWIPGKKYGQPIRSQVTIPIDFEISDPM